MYLLIRKLIFLDSNRDDCERPSFFSWHSPSYSVTKIAQQYKMYCCSWLKDGGSQASLGTQLRQKNGVSIRLQFCKTRNDLATEFHILSFHWLLIVSSRINSNENNSSQKGIFHFILLKWFGGHFFPTAIFQFIRNICKSCSSLIITFFDTCGYRNTLFLFLFLK